MHGTKRESHGMSSQTGKMETCLISADKSLGSWMIKINQWVGGTASQPACVLDVMGHGICAILRSCRSVPASHQCDCMVEELKGPERLRLCHVKCGQGVPGLALTTEQGSVFVLGSIWLLFVPTLAHCVAEPVEAKERQRIWEKTCGKANSAELVFESWLSPAAQELFFSTFKCCPHGH